MLVYFIICVLMLESKLLRATASPVALRTVLIKELNISRLCVSPVSVGLQPALESWLPKFCHEGRIWAAGRQDEGERASPCFGLAGTPPAAARAPGPFHSHTRRYAPLVV